MASAVAGEPLVLPFDRELAAAAAAEATASTSSSSSSSTAPANALPIVILPGFGNVRDDYLAPYGPGSEGEALATHLRERGWRVDVADVMDRRQWINVARGLLTLKFWSGRLTTDPGYTW